MILIIPVLCLVLLILGLLAPYRVYRLARWVSKWLAPKFSIGLALAYPSLFFLALAGLCRQDGAPFCTRSFFESARLYEAVQVLLHNWTPEGEPAGMMKWVLVGAPLALVLTFIPLAANILERVLPGYAMRKMRGHVIIVGVGDKSRQLTADFLAEQKKTRGFKRGLVVVGDDPEDYHRDFCERHAVLYTGCGGNLEETLWRHCAVRRAETLALVDDDDDRNLGAFLRMLEEQARLAVSVVKTRTPEAGTGRVQRGENHPPPLRILLHLASPDVLDAFDLEKLSDAALDTALNREKGGPPPDRKACAAALRARLKVYPYNIHQNAVLDLFDAKLFLRPGAACWLKPAVGDELRVVIAGHGYVGRKALETLLQLAHSPNQGKRPDPRKIRVDVVDRAICDSDGTDTCDNCLADSLRQTHKVANIMTRRKDLLHPDLIQEWTKWVKERISLPEGVPPPGRLKSPIVFVLSLGGTTTDLDNIEYASRLTSRFIASNCPPPLVFVRAANHHGTGSWRDMQTRATRKNPGKDDPRIYPFGMISDTSSLSDILAQKTEIRAALSGWSWGLMNNACDPGRLPPGEFASFEGTIGSLLRSCADKLKPGGRLEIRWQSNRFPALHAPVRVALLEDSLLREFFVEGLRGLPAWATAGAAIHELKNAVKSALRTAPGHLDRSLFLKGLNTFLNTPPDDPDRLELKTMVVHGLAVCEFESTAQPIAGLMQNYRKLNTQSLSLRDLSFQVGDTARSWPDADPSGIAASIRTAGEHFPKTPLLTYLGQHEHTRWVAEKWLSGNTDHPCLVDDDDLPHIMKSMDHIQVASFAAHDLIEAARDGI
jgi:hypothetical protein